MYVLTHFLKYIPLVVLIISKVQSAAELDEKLRYVPTESDNTQLTKVIKYLVYYFRYHGCSSDSGAHCFRM